MSKEDQKFSDLPKSAKPEGSKELSSVDKILLEAGIQVTELEHSMIFVNPPKSWIERLRKEKRLSRANKKGKSLFKIISAQKKG